MRFLLDRNMSPTLVELLAAADHDAVHARQLGLSRAPDDLIMETAASEGRGGISGDTDFGELLARTNAEAPSILLLRRQRERRAFQIAELIALNLDAVAEELDQGANVVFDDDRIRIRLLPLDVYRHF